MIKLLHLCVTLENTLASIPMTSLQNSLTVNVHSSSIVQRTTTRGEHKGDPNVC